MRAHTTVSRPSSKRRIHDAQGSSLPPRTGGRDDLYRWGLFYLSAKTTHSRPFRVLRVSREPHIPVLLDCRMNRFHIPMDTSFYVPTRNSDTDRGYAIGRSRKRTLMLSKNSDSFFVPFTTSDPNDLYDQATRQKNVENTKLKPELCNTPSSDNKKKLERGIFGQSTSRRIQSLSLTSG